MKLKNKLLPLVGVGAACAAITPLAMLSSCKNDGDYDFLKLYQPTIKQHDVVKTGYSIIEANNEYTEQVVANPEIFKQDFLWSKTLFTDRVISRDSVAQNKATAAEAGGVLNSVSKINAHFGNLDIKAKEMKVQGKTVNIMSVSFDFSYEASYDWTENDINYINTTKVSIEGKNIPYGATSLLDEPYGSVVSYWALQPMTEVLSAGVQWGSWSMKYNFDLYETQIKKNPGGEHSTTVNDNVNFFVNDQNIQQQSSQKIGFIIKQLTSRDYFDSKPSYDCLYTVSAYSYYFQRVLPTEGGK